MPLKQGQNYNHYRVPTKVIYCENCGIEKIARITSNQKFCGHSCAAKGTKNGKTAENKKVLWQCLECGVIKYLSIAKAESRKFCSHSCKTKFLKPRLGTGVKREIRNCSLCGVETTNPKFCSVKCSLTYYNKSKIGEKRSLESIEKMKRTYSLHPELHIIYKCRQKGFKTSIERIVEDFIGSLQIRFISQYYVRGWDKINKKPRMYFIDIYLPSFNLGIECDGEYWHKEINLDRDYFIKGKGINLLHLPEKMIREGSFKEVLVNAMA